MWRKAMAGLGLVAILIAAVIGGGIGKQIGKDIFAPPKPTAEQIEQKLIEGFKKAAEQSNRLGPRMVDENTRWDRTAVGPGARVTYFYSFPNYSSQDITAIWLHENLKPVVRKSVCASKEMRPSLQYGGLYIYSYSGNNGTEITRFEFKQHDCSSPLPQESTVRAPTYDSQNNGQTAVFLSEAAKEIIARFPQLDIDSPNKDQESIDFVVRTRDGYIAKGYSMDIALRMAANDYGEQQNASLQREAEQRYAQQITTHRFNQPSVSQAQPVTNDYIRRKNDPCQAKAVMSDEDIARCRRR